MPRTLGKITALEVTLQVEGGGVVTPFPISVQQLDDLLRSAQYDASAIVGRELQETVALVAYPAPPEEHGQ